MFGRMTGTLPMTRHATSITGIILLALSDTLASGCLWIWQLPLIGIAFLIFEGTGVMMSGIITTATPLTTITSSSFTHSRPFFVPLSVARGGGGGGGGKVAFASGNAFDPVSTTRRHAINSEYLVNRRSLY